MGRLSSTLIPLFTLSEGSLGKCPKEARCPHGAIFIEDAAFFIEDTDGHRDLAIDVIYHVRHSLITVIPPHGYHSNGSDARAVSEFNTDEDVAIEINEPSGSKSVLLVLAFVVIGMMCTLLVLCGYTTYKYPLEVDGVRVVVGMGTLKRVTQ